jgi:YD repeat-containing protein
VKHEAGSAVTRLSWDEAHRLEVNLRARAHRLGRPVGRCPGCGHPTLSTDEQMRFAGLAVHSGCIFLCRDDPLAVA